MRPSYFLAAATIAAMTLAATPGWAEVIRVEIGVEGMF